jgi:hypothetical protein
MYIFFAVSFRNRKSNLLHLKLWQLLDTREKLKENRTLKPIISQFYERLRSYQMEADHLAVTYNNMCQSLKYVYLLNHANSEP